MSSMIIIIGKDYYFHRCPFHKIDEYKDSERKIPTYYSEQGAYDAGWSKTRDKIFLIHEETHIWLCPECSKKYNLGNKKNV